jgi:hypothetical protein
MGGRPPAGARHRTSAGRLEPETDGPLPVAARADRDRPICARGGRSHAGGGPGGAVMVHLSRRCGTAAPNAAGAGAGPPSGAAMLPALRRALLQQASLSAPRPPGAGRRARACMRACPTRRACAAAGAPPTRPPAAASPRPQRALGAPGAWLAPAPRPPAPAARPRAAAHDSGPGPAAPPPPPPPPASPFYDVPRTLRVLRNSAAFERSAGCGDAVGSSTSFSQFVAATLAGLQGVDLGWEAKTRLGLLAGRCERRRRRGLVWGPRSARAAGRLPDALALVRSPPRPRRHPCRHPVTQVRPVRPAAIPRAGAAAV